MGLGIGFRIWIWNSDFRIQTLGFGISGLGCRVLVEEAGSEMSPNGMVLAWRVCTSTRCLSVRGFLWKNYLDPQRICYVFLDVASSSYLRLKSRWQWRGGGGVGGGGVYLVCKVPLYL